MSTHRFSPLIGSGGRLVGGILLLTLAAGTGLLPARDEPVAVPYQPKADAELQRIRDRLSGPLGDRSAVRRDLLAFRLAYPGTPAAARAAALLSGLVSPLDALSPRNIPALERFDWQPKELVGILGEHRGRHGSPVTCITYSPDGKLVASGGTHLVRVWDADTLRLQGTGTAYYITSIAFSHDGKALVVGGAYGDLRVLDIGKGNAPQLRYAVQAGTSSIYAVAFNPDNRSVAAACYDNNIRAYDVSGKQIKELAVVSGHTKSVTALAYTPDGKMLVSGSADQTIRLWNVNGGAFTERASLDAVAKDVKALSVTHSGLTLAAAASDGNVRLWSMPAVSKQGPRATLAVGTAVTSISFSGSGNNLAVGCTDNTVRLWRVTGQPKELAKMDGHADPVTGVAYSANGTRIASGSADWTVRSWDLSGPKPKERFTPWSHLSHVYSVDFATDSQSLVSGSEDRVVRVWDLTKTDLKTRNYLKGDPVAIYTVAYSPDGKLVAASGNVTKIRQWDAVSGREKTPLTPTPGAVYRVQYSSDSRRLLSTGTHDVTLWDNLKGIEVRRFNIGAAGVWVNCAVLAPDGRHVLTGQGTHKIDKDGKPVYKKNGQPEYVDCYLRLFGTDEDNELTIDKSQELPIHSVAFSMDSRTGYSGAYLEPALRRWDVSPKALKALPAWKGSSGYPSAILPSPDGQTLVTRNLDGEVILWDVASGKRLKGWSIPEVVGYVAYSLDSRHLAISLGTGVIYILRLGPPSPTAGG
jgi:WD40 repeat protein